MIRSKLFVPGSRPEIFERAVASAADAISFDLEDAVTIDKKADARANIAAFLSRGNTPHGKTIIVRVNALLSSCFDADIEAIISPHLHIVNVPKVESRKDVIRAIESISLVEKARGIEGKTNILANIETPKGLRFAAEIATASARVVGLQIGFKDLLTRWGIDGGDAIAQQQIRLQVRLAAAEAGIATYDGAFSNVKDLEGFRAEAHSARGMGFAGKSCIHPTQISIANEVFAHSDAEIVYAERVIVAAREAAGRGEGVFTLDGQMIDNPMVENARAVVAAVEKLRAAKS